MKRRVWIAMWALLLLGPACGSDVSWFVSFNSVDVDDAIAGGFVLVIGTPHEKPLEAVELVEGEIPNGMHLEKDGTVRGIPEEGGEFDFTLRLTERSGRVLEKSYSVEVDAEPARR